VPTHAFGPFELDTERGALQAPGEPIALSPKATLLLIYLVEHAGRDLDRAELLANVWGVHSRSPSTVPTAIAAIRRALGDDPKHPTYVRTVGQGAYRFIAAVRTVEKARSDSDGRHSLASGLIGRTSELGRLQRALDLASQGRPATLLFFGEPGIGKTRLLDEFLRDAQRQGAACAIARCPEDEGAPALWPWARILNSEAFSGLAQLPLRVPLNGDRGKPRGSSASTRAANDAEDPEKRFRLFDSIARSVIEAAGIQPVLVAFDDLHRADVPSLRLLNHVVREASEARLLTVGTYRDIGSEAGVEVRTELARLGRHERAETVALRPLSRSELSELARALWNPMRATEALAAELYERSGGNPFLATQLIEVLKTRAPGDERASDLPRGLRAIVLEQLEGLSDGVIDRLAACAVAGRNFSTELVAEALGVPKQQLLDELDAALARGLLVPAHESPGRLRFVHALVRDALYAELTSPERAALHYALGGALAHQRGDDPLAQAELAHHFFHSAAVGGARRAVLHAVAAAKDAAARLALEDVPRHYRRALRALEHLESSTKGERCRLLVSLGDAEIRAGERANGRATLREAGALAKQIGDATLLAQAALSLAPGPLAIEIDVFDPLLVSLLQDALACVPTEHGRLRAQLLARLSLAMTSSGKEARRARLAREALSAAAGTQEPATRADALIAHYRTLAGPAHSDQRRNISRELAELAELHPDPSLCFMQRILHITELLQEGRIAAVDEEIHLFEVEAATRCLPPFRWYPPMFAAMRAFMKGRLDHASRLADQFRQAGARTEDENAAQSFGAHRAVQLWEQGHAGRGASLIEPFIEKLHSPQTWRSGLAFCLCDSGQLEAAQRQLDRIASDGFEEVPRNELWLVTLATTSITSAWLRDVRRAEQLYALLLPGADQYAVLGFGVMFFGSVSHYLGMLATALERWDDAERHFEHALHQNARADAPLWMAHTHLEHARALALRGHVSRARVSARRAADLAGQLDLVNIHRKATQLLGALPSAREPSRPS
jgi:DNA-binding winged helix-turn-helix (wHTH) protein/tetratricopeptide (TPR) repeat protein